MFPICTRWGYRYRYNLTRIERELRDCKALWKVTTLFMSFRVDYGVIQFVDEWHSEESKGEMRRADAGLADLLSEVRLFGGGKKKKLILRSPKCFHKYDIHIEVKRFRSDTYWHSCIVRGTKRKRKGGRANSKSAGQLSLIFPGTGK